MLIIECPYPCLRCSVDSLAFCESCSQEVYISFDHLIPEEKIEELDDYLMNDVNIFDIEEGNLTNFTARGMLHGDCFSLSKK